MSLIDRQSPISRCPSSISVGKDFSARSFLVCNRWGWTTVNLSSGFTGPWRSSKYSCFYFKNYVRATRLRRRQVASIQFIASDCMQPCILIAYVLLNGLYASVAARNALLRWIRAFVRELAILGDTFVTSKPYYRSSGNFALLAYIWSFNEIVKLVAVILEIGWLEKGLQV
jgi:hypothetical protein